MIALVSRLIIYDVIVFTNEPVKDEEIETKNEENKVAEPLAEEIKVIFFSEICLSSGEEVLNYSIISST